jgi:hypothetical protein
MQRDYFANPQNRQMGVGLDLQARRKTGATFPVEVNLSHIETPTGGLGIASVTDITQRRHLEEERQKFVSLVDRSPEFIAMCDVDFLPFNVNPAGARLAGIGTKLIEPNIDYATMAKGYGMEGIGPITDPNDIALAIKKGLEIVSRGEPVLIDTVTQGHGGKRHEG